MKNNRQLAKNLSKKSLNKHKKVLEAIQNQCDLYEIYEQFGVTEEDIKYWRKTISDFNMLYLEAVGLTSIQEQFIEVFPKKLLNVAATCKAVNIHRSTYYSWVDKSDTFRRFLDEIIEGMKDDVETILYQKIFIDKDIKALYLFLRHKMKERGYGDNSISIVNNQQNISLNSLSSFSSCTLRELDDEIAILEKKILKI